MVTITKLRQIEPIRPYREIVDLVAGVNIIQHNRGYSELIVDMRDNDTGNTINARVKNETDTTVEIHTTTSQNNVCITIR